MRLCAGLQNRSARFDSSVPRLAFRHEMPGTTLWMRHSRGRAGSPPGAAQRCFERVKTGTKTGTGVESVSASAAVRNRPLLAQLQPRRQTITRGDELKSALVTATRRGPYWFYGPEPVDRDSLRCEANCQCRCCACARDAAILRANHRRCARVAVSQRSSTGRGQRIRRLRCGMEHPVERPRGFSH
jgi:hypothetical protein